MSRKILRDLRYISIQQVFVSVIAKYFQLKALKAMKILNVEQMSVREKCKS